MSLTISLRFPTGRYAAAAWDDKDRAEWPPHPARLMLAFIDVLHKAGNPPNLRAALSWLCEQGAPSITIPAAHHLDIQNMDGFFVPQNPSEATGPKHQRKSRSFPSVFLDAEIDTVFFHWQDADLGDAELAALQELAERLPRFGHSSSLVVAGASKANPPVGAFWQTLEPSSDSTTHADHSIRVPYSGLIESAESAFDADARSKEMNSLMAKAAGSAKPTKTLKPAASSRGRHDPRHQWLGYSEKLPTATPTTCWDSRFLLLARTDGNRPGLSSSWQIIETFHKTLLDRWTRDPQRGPVPSWISGHEPGSGSTAPATANHLAFFPVADVHHKHAQGRIMGIGLAFPRPETCGLDAITLRLDWKKALASLFPEGDSLELVLSSDGSRIVFEPASPEETRLAFLPRRWTGPSRTWSSITPVVLERHPKPHFRKNPEAWAKSSAQIIREACHRIGLPEPTKVNVSPYSAIQGVPPSAAFNPPPARPGRPQRAHFHVSIQFDQKVSGPILLGAGRFRGYGLLAPVE